MHIRVYLRGGGDRLGVQRAHELARVGVRVRPAGPPCDVIDATCCLSRSLSHLQ